MSEFNPEKHELYTIKEDAVRGAGDHAGQRGLASTIRIPRWGVAMVTYKDRVVEADVYKEPGEDNHFTILWVCPRCTNQLRIDTKKKQVEIRVDRVAPGGERIVRLFIEPFECTWELGRGTDGTKNDRIAFGAGLCRLRVGVYNNIAKDA